MNIVENDPLRCPPQLQHNKIEEFRKKLQKSKKKLSNSDKYKFAKNLVYDEDPELGITCLHELIQLLEYKHDANCYYYLSIGHAKKGDIDEAIKYCNQALETPVKNIEKQKMINLRRHLAKMKRLRENQNEIADSVEDQNQMAIPTDAMTDDISLNFIIFAVIGVVISIVLSVLLIVK